TSAAIEMLWGILANDPYAVHRFAKLEAAGGATIFLSKGAKVAVVLDAQPDDPRETPLKERRYQLLYCTAGSVLADAATLVLALDSALTGPAR
ncbi:MAG: hypothetical protein ABI743_12675, partial [bacterium]